MYCIQVKLAINMVLKREEKIFFWVFERLLNGINIFNHDLLSIFEDFIILRLSIFRNHIQWKI